MPTTVFPPAPSACVPIPSPYFLTPPGPSLIHPDQYETFLARPLHSHRLPVPATFLSGCRLASRSS